MAKSNFIETKKAVDDITTAIDKQIASATTLNDKVISLNSNYAKIPSEYLKNQKEIAETNKTIAQSEKAVQEAIIATQRAKKTNATLTQQEKTDLQIINVEKRREAVLNSQVAGEYRKLSTAVAQASDKYQNLLVRGRLASQSQREFNKELSQAQKEFQTLQNKVLSADKAVDKWNRTGERTISLGRDLMSSFGVVGGVTLFSMLSKDIFEQTKEIQFLNKALELVTGTQENFYAQQVFLADISDRYGVKLNDLTKQFTQFYVSAKDKLSGDKIQQIFESITKAGASMGLSVESQQRAFLALNQMMSKGTIQAEELRGQLGEALPGAFGIMAKAVGVTEKELAKMMKAGDLLAKDVLPKFAKQLEITYGIENVTRIDNIVSAQNRLSNAWRNFIASLDKDGNKFSMFLTKALNVLSDIIKGMEIAFESDEQSKKRISDTIHKNAYKSQLEYLNSLKDGQEESIQATKEFNRRHIIENNQLIKNLIEKNKELKEKFKGFYANKSDLKEQYDANITSIENLRAVNQRYFGQIKAGHQFELESKQKTNDETKTQTELTKEQIKAQEKLNKKIEEELRLRNALLIARANRELIGLKNQLENEKVYINDRLTLLDEIAKKETEIELLKYQENIRLHKNSNTQMEIDAIEFQNKIDEINKNRIDNGLKELSRYYAEFEDYQKKFDGDGIKLNIFGDNPEDGFEKWKKGAEKAKEATDDLKNSTKEWLKSFEDSFIGDTGFTTLFDIINKKIDGFGENFSTTFIGITEVMQEAMAFMSDASNQRFENEKNNLEQEHKLAIDLAGGSASAIDEINRQYDARQREIRVREAKAKRTLAISNIAIDTAQAIMATYARLGFPAGLIPSIVMAGIGATQAIMVANQELPAYWNGTENHKGGFMKINDRGLGQEMVITPDGKKTIYEGEDVIVNAPKGTKVKTASETIDYLMFNNNLNSMLTSNNIGLPNINVESQKIDLTPIIKAIENKQETQFIYDGVDLITRRKKANQTIEDAIKRTLFVGKNV